MTAVGAAPAGIVRAALLLTLLLVSPAAAGRVPSVGTPVVFASDVAGPEGVAFDRSGRLVAGTATGQVLRFNSDGSRFVLAELGEPLAGITVLRDGRILAASFGAGSVWEVDSRTGASQVFATGVPGVNFILQTKRRQILASLSGAGTIVDITSGTPIVRASGLSYPNGLAQGPERSLYVAQTGASNVVRMTLARDGTLGPAQAYASGILAADGIGFDRAGNLLAVGADTLYTAPRGGGAATALSTDPLLNWPSNVALARGRGFGRDLYLANFGLPLGSGTNILRMPYSLVRE